MPNDNERNETFLHSADRSSNVIHAAHKGFIHFSSADGIAKSRSDWWQTAFGW